MADIWRRFVFSFDCYPWCFFKELLSAQDEGQRKLVARQARSRACSCIQCVDSSFTEEVLRFIGLGVDQGNPVLDPAALAQVHQAMLDASSVYPTNTAPVEVRHGD
eukprot:7604478-Alexandrium_andersonii.AAC.1